MTKKIQLIEASNDDQGNARNELYGLLSRDRFQEAATTTASLTANYRLEAVHDSSKLTSATMVSQALNTLGDILVARQGTRPASLEWQFGSAGAGSSRTRAGAVTSGIAMEVLIDEAQFANVAAVRTALRAL